MIKLFKAKSLKKTQETEQGVGVGADGVAGAQGAKVGAGVQGTDGKNAKKQRGRSMVEMLGVLAIIGVLSIGGIQGYTMAMRKYRANEILNLVTKYAMFIYSGCQQAMANESGVVYTYEDDIYDDDASYHKDLKSEKIPYSIHCTDDAFFWFCPVPYFSDAGLGDLPQGISRIGPRTDLSENNCTYSPLNWDREELRYCENVVTINSVSSGDIVAIRLLFTDKELCESVSGVANTFDYHGEPCSEEENGYFLVVATIMN